MVARGFWLRLLVALLGLGAVPRSTTIDSTYVKAQPAALRGKRELSAGVRSLARRLDDPDPGLGLGTRERVFGAADHEGQRPRRGRRDAL